MNFSLYAKQLWTPVDSYFKLNAHVEAVAAYASSGRRPLKGAYSLDTVISLRLRRLSRTNMSRSHRKRCFRFNLVSFIMPIANNPVRSFESSNRFEQSTKIVFGPHRTRFILSRLRASFVQFFNHISAQTSCKFDRICHFVATNEKSCTC